MLKLGSARLADQKAWFGSARQKVGSGASLLNKYLKFDLFVESRSFQTLSVKSEKSAEIEKLTPSLRLDRAYSFELMSLVGVACSD